MPRHPDKDKRKRRYKLRNLVLERIDRVARGDNPEAFIALAKTAPIEKQETKTEDGVAYPPSDFAYVPDREKPSTWKLRLTSEPGGSPDPQIVGAAAAALGPGFRGNRVQIPREDRPAVIRRVRAAWLKANRDKDREQMPDVLKGFPATPPTVTPSRKGDSSMPETVEIDKETREALPDDVREYVESVEKRADDAEAKLQESDISKLTEERDYVVEVGKSLDERIEAFEAEKAEFEKATGERTQIDKSDLPEEVVKQLEEAEAQREIVEKMRDERDLERRVAKAKDYENVGSADDLGDLLHRLAKVADDEDLDKLEETLKAAHERIDTSVIFSEAGARQAIEGSAYQKIQKRAEAIRKDDPDLTAEAAELKAVEENPDLAAEYRAEQGS